MTNPKYAVISTSKFEGLLQVHILLEDISDIKEAEYWRTGLLKGSPKLDPRKVKVIQYVT